MPFSKETQAACKEIQDKYSCCDVCLSEPPKFKVKKQH